MVDSTWLIDETWFVDSLYPLNVERLKCDFNSPYTLSAQERLKYDFDSPYPLGKLGR